MLDMRMEMQWDERVADEIQGGRTVQYCSMHMSLTSFSLLVRSDEQKRGKLQVSPQLEKHHIHTDDSY